MINSFKTWTDLKTIFIDRILNLQYEEDNDKYYLYCIDKDIIYFTELWKNTDIIKGININQNNIDLSDFENNYKLDSNKLLEPRSEDGKSIIRSESRPLGHTTYFTGSGDSETIIGEGKEFFWDFSNDDDEIDMPSGSIYKRKRIEFKFIDSVYIKEGAIYYHNKKKKSYIDMYIVCPAGQWYYDNNNNPKQAQVDTPIAHYVNHCLMAGSVPMGDELNTESCSAEISSNFKFWIDITVPEEDNESYGHVELELYRKRTIIL